MVDGTNEQTRCRIIDMETNTESIISLWKEVLGCVYHTAFHDIRLPKLRYEAQVD